MPADDCIQPASVDVHLSSKFLRFVRGQTLDTRVPPLMEEIIVPEGDSLVMLPGTFLIASTIERVVVPSHLAARLEGKSKLARYGLIIHAAGFFDPGFGNTVDAYGNPEGATGTLELFNLSGEDLTLHPGDKIGQFSFHLLDDPAERPYGHPDLHNHYAGQDGPTAARP